MVASSRSGYKKGQVKFYDSRKGFGFIKPDDESPDVFLSGTRLAKGITGLMPGQSCMFTVEAGKNGRPRAREFSLL